MGIIKSRLSVLQEAQETSLTVHAALCKEATATTSKLTVSRSDSRSSSQPASPPDVAPGFLSSRSCQVPGVCWCICIQAP